MRVKVSSLKRMIHEAVKTQYYPMITLSSGEETEWGSPEHVLDMENALETLCTIRNQQRPATAARTRYSQACSQLRSQIKSARARLAKTAEVEAPVESGAEDGEVVEIDVQ